MGTITTPMFEILATLPGGALHGYAIAKKIAQVHGNNASSMGPAKLYTSLQKLIEQGMIEEVEVPGGDPRRKSYRLTQSGLGVLSDEMGRRQRFLDAANSWMGKPTASGRLV